MTVPPAVAATTVAPATISRQRSVGVLLPTRELAARGTWDTAPLLDDARRAERAGLDSVWVGDSLTARPRHDPLTLLSAVATATDRVDIGTAALVAARYPALPSAASIATLDRLAAGRLVVGIAAGFPSPDTEAEFAAAGACFRTRFSATADHIERWRSAWGDAAEFPRPTGPGGPPLWFAGAGPRSLALTAARFDGWLPYLPDPAAYREAAARLDELVQSDGRDPSTIRRGLFVTVLADGDPGELDRWARAYYGVGADDLARVQAVVSGSIAECTARLAAFAGAGADHFVVRIGSLDFARHLDGVAVMGEQLRWAADPW